MMSPPTGERLIGQRGGAALNEIDSDDRPEWMKDYAALRRPIEWPPLEETGAEDNTKPAAVRATAGKAGALHTQMDNRAHRTRTPELEAQEAANNNSQIRKEEEQPLAPAKKGNTNMQRATAYLLSKQQIIADVKEMGVEQARRKHGIPESTWKGWLHKPQWRELADAVAGVKEENTDTVGGWTPEEREAVIKHAQEQTAPTHNEEQPPFSVDITIKTLEQIAEGLEAQARGYRETVASLSKVKDTAK